jgi:hypothetical protein
MILSDRGQGNFFFKFFFFPGVVLIVIYLSFGVLSPVPFYVFLDFCYVLLGAWHEQGMPGCLLFRVHVVRKGGWAWDPLHFNSDDLGRGWAVRDRRLGEEVKGVLSNLISSHLLSCT